ncbi:MAG TPA: hypothetical protein VMQ60_03205 [Acidobacteriaceae bacterium]|jgi:hypothetical protein|nr:hypothetical protein [Acidobacteriaceae bacterium]
MFALFCIAALALVTVLLFATGQIVLGAIAGLLCVVGVFAALGLMDKVFFPQ